MNVDDHIAILDTAGNIQNNNRDLSLYIYCTCTLTCLCCIHVCDCMQMYAVYLQARAHVYVYVCEWVFVYICASVCVLCVCVCVCVCESPIAFCAYQYTEYIDTRRPLFIAGYISVLSFTCISIHAHCLVVVVYRPDLPT